MKINMIMRYLKIEDLNERETQKVWCVIQNIKETLAIRHPSNSISISISTHLSCPDNYKISEAEVYEILKEFQGKRILKILKIQKLNETLGSIPIKVNKKRFNPEYKEAEKRIKMFNLRKSQEVESLKRIKLYLTSEGDLYRGPKKKYCYPMSKNRHKIVQCLAKNKSYQSTPLIRIDVGGKSEDSIRTEISKINQIAKGKLGIKDNIIKGRKGSGYRVNPEYKITFKKE